MDIVTPPSAAHLLKSPIAGHTRSALKSKSMQGLTPLETAKTVGKVDFPDLEVEVKSSKKQKVIVEEVEEQEEEEQEEPPPEAKEMEMDEPSDSNKDEPPRFPPQIDVSVQRLRHLGYVPKPILAMEATPTHSDACDYVAVARENGHVELKSPDEKWRTLAVVPGMPSRTVDVMTWVCGNCDEDTATTSTTTFSSTFHQTHSMIHAKRTLIGASRDGTLFVVDFQHGRHTAVAGSGGGGVFSLVTLCGRKTCADGTCAHLVAAGCEDGSVRLFKLNNGPSNDTTLDLVATIPCSGSAILSLAWRRLEAGSQGMGGTVLYAGVADGTIRRFDCASALAKARATHTTGSSMDLEGAQHHSWKSTLRMTVESYGRRTPTRVWALVALADGTVVSGDSLGHVQFWDGMTGTMLQTFDQNDNKADVLDLAVSENESTVYASGVDSRVVSIERPAVLPNSKFLDGPLKWILTHARRPHTHDVKALAICRLRDRKASLAPDKDQHEILCSGGIDTKICTYLVREFKRIRPKSWYPWPTVSPITVAKEARIICMLREDIIELHRLEPQHHPKGRRVLLPEQETLLGSMEIKSRHNLVCADISPDGELLAVSDGASLMMFELQHFEEGGSAGFVPQKIELDVELRSPCLTLKFASNEQLICATSDGPIRVLKIGSNESEEVDSDKVNVSEAHVFDEHMTDNANPIHSICVRGDGRWFSVARGGVGNGCVNIFTLPSGDEGSYSYWWSLPALEAPISSVKFLESEQPEIVAACSNFSFYVFDVNAKRLGEWSENEGFPLTPKLPYELTHQNDAALRCATNPATPQKFMLVS
jgi:U3 small nucleolar RNA-associated protein 4